MQRQKIVAGISNNTRPNFSYFKCMKNDMIMAALTTDKMTSKVNMSVAFKCSYARKTSRPVIATRPTQMPMLVPTLAPAWASSACACVFMDLFFSRTAGLVLHRHQVNQGKHEHPDQVDKVPVQPVHFNVLGGELAAPIAECHDPQVNHADHDVRHVQAGDPEEHGAEKRSAFRVSNNGEVFFENHVHPLGQVQPCKEQPSHHGGNHPQDRLLAVVALRRHHGHYH